MIARRCGSRRIFVECTYTYFVGGISGIRRVARNLANQGRVISNETVEVVPLIWGGVGFFSPRRNLKDCPHPLVRAAKYLSVFNRFQQGVDWLLGKLFAALEPLTGKLPTKAKKVVRLVFRSSLRATRVIVGAPFRLIHQLVRGGVRPHRADELVYLVFGLLAIPLGFFFVSWVRFRQGDIVMLVDSTWNSQRMLKSLINAQREPGIRVGVMLHDLFPLTIPEMCNEETVRGYRNWFEFVAPAADLFVTNSQATKHSLESHFLIQPHLRSRPWRAGCFRLGAVLDQAKPGVNSEKNRWIADLSGFVVLVVGTIEPRKNYQVILDALDMLWAQAEITLLIVGRPGWKSDDVIERIVEHPLFGDRLLHLDDADDSELEAAFRRADCLICASWAEGFGLPVVEGLLHDVPVLASDIEVFREVGGEACHFFPPDRPCVLADMLSERFDNGSTASVLGTMARERLSITWKESAIEFRDVVLRLTSDMAPGSKWV